MTSTSSAHLTCLCGAVSVFGAILAAPELPIYKETCHCNSCRHVTGVLGASFPPLKTAPPQDTLSKLTGYKSSQYITRYFCSKCGSHCFASSLRSKRWSCLGGIIEQSPSSKADGTPWPKDVVKVWYHDFVLDTLDGGLAPFQLSLDGRSIPTWEAEGPEPPPQDGSFDLPHATVLSLPKKSKTTLPQAKKGSFLPAKCHCGGVSLLIKRASHTSTSNPEDSRCYNLSDPTKYLAYFCACRSCRLATGASLVPWALVPPDGIFNANASTSINQGEQPSEDNLKPLIFGYSTSESDVNPGLMLKHYWSSPDTCWSFCSKCGATMFYWCGRRPEELDLAVGILRSEDGSMARSWLEWDWGRCSFAEECVDGETYEAWLTSREIMEEIGG